MSTELVVGCWLLVVRGVREQFLVHSRITINGQRTTMIWHFRRDWSFTPFVVVVGGKYFLPAPECLLFDWVNYGSRRDVSG